MSLEEYLSSLHKALVEATEGSVKTMVWFGILAVRLGDLAALIAASAPGSVGTIRKSTFSGRSAAASFQWAATEPPPGQLGVVREGGQNESTHHFKTKCVSMLAPKIKMEIHDLSAFFG